MKSRKWMVAAVLLVALAVITVGCKDKKFGIYKSIVITEEGYVELAKGTIQLYKDGKITEAEYEQLKASGKKTELAINTAKMALRLYVSFEDDTHYAELVSAVGDMMRLFEEFRAQFVAKGGGVK